MEGTTCDLPESTDSLGGWKVPVGGDTTAGLAREVLKKDLASSEGVTGAELGDWRPVVGWPQGNQRIQGMGKGVEFRGLH